MERTRRRRVSPAQAAWRETLDTWVAQLDDELRMAIRWQRPSILFAVCDSAVWMGRAQAKLEQLARKRGQKVEVLRTGLGRLSDIPLRLSRKRNRGATVYFVVGIAAGREAALRALNARREYLIEKEFRVVFWLTELEEQAIARAAPDFWAFRHRVTYFRPDLALERPLAPDNAGKAL